MRYLFGNASEARLATCDARIQSVARLALARSLCDFSIVTGHRDEAAQNAAFESGHSQLRWPEGNHNAIPSRALDFSPYPNPWSPRPKLVARYYLIAGAFHAAALELRIAIRWGGDWDGDGDLTDQSFDDLGHVELLGWQGPEPITT